MQIDLLDSACELSDADWQRLATGGDPFISRAFLGAAEETGAAGTALAWQALHLALRDDAGRLAGLLPLYLREQGEAATGVIGALHYLPSLDTPENEAFVTAYQVDHPGKLPSEYVVAGYDAGRLLLGALETGAEGREALATALPKVAYSGPRGPLEIDPATNNIVQNVYVFETVPGGEAGMTHKLLETIPAVRDAPNGCVMG